MQENKEKAQKILEEEKVYSDKNAAVSACVTIDKGTPTFRAHVLCMSLFYNVDGVILTSHGTFRSRCDMDVTEIISSPYSIHEKLADCILGMAQNPPCIEIKHSWSYTARVVYVCPWGRKFPYHIIPVSDMDIRAKEALASLISCRAFTTTSPLLSGDTYYMGSFRYDNVANYYLETKGGRQMLCTAFLLYLGLKCFFNSMENTSNDRDKSLSIAKRVLESIRLEFNGIIDGKESLREVHSMVSASFIYAKTYLETFNYVYKRKQDPILAYMRACLSSLRRQLE
jgi:hypothetical protein